MSLKLTTPTRRCLTAAARAFSLVARSIATFAVAAAGIVKANATPFPLEGVPDSFGFAEALLLPPPAGGAAASGSAAPDRDRLAAAGGLPYVEFDRSLTLNA